MTLCTYKLSITPFAENAMATHSSTLSWRIPGTGEPGGLPSMRSHRVRHDWSDLAAAAANPLCNNVSLGFPGGSDGKESSCNMGKTRVLSWIPGERMATHSSIPCLENPWTEEPGGLQSMGSQRVGHDWVTNTTTTHIRVYTQVSDLDIIYQFLWHCIVYNTF